MITASRFRPNTSFHAPETEFKKSTRRRVLSHAAQTSAKMPGSAIRVRNLYCVLVRPVLIVKDFLYEKFTEPLAFL